jgi:hypothetical protein
MTAIMDILDIIDDFPISIMDIFDLRCLRAPNRHSDIPLCVYTSSPSLRYTPVCMLAFTDTQINPPYVCTPSPTLGYAHYADYVHYVHYGSHKQKSILNIISIMEIGKSSIMSTITTGNIRTIWNGIFGFPEIHLISELHTISGQSL